MPRRGRKSSGPKPKAVNFDLIDRMRQPAIYALLDEVREEFHEETQEARVTLAWRKGLKPDVDGRLVLGRCVKASDLQRELANWDFVIVINREAWEALAFEKDTQEKRQKALLDHEMCHVGQVLDKYGEPKLDEKGRRVWRIRKHDIEEFRSVVAHHGCYKRDLEHFAEAVLKSRQGELELAAK